jgi:hypothetical protein
MLQHLRRRAAADTLAEVLLERQRRGFDDRSARTAGLIRLTQAARIAGRISFEQYVATAGHMAEHVHEGRWMDGAYDAALAPHKAAMRIAEECAGLTEGQAFDLQSAPEKYTAANAAFDSILDAHFVEVLLEFDLTDIVELWQRDQGEYRRLCEIGRTKYRTAVTPVAAVSALISVYEEEAGKCERASAYHSACAMLGAAAEARLLERALSDPAVTELARLSISARAPRKQNPLTWTFEQLVVVALAAGWIGTISDDGGDYDFFVGGLLTELRRMRNYVHAGRACIEKPLEVLTKHEVEDARATYGSLIFSLQLSSVEVSG